MPIQLRDWIGIFGHVQKRQAHQLAESCGRDAQQISKAAGKRAYTVVADVITDVYDLAFGLHEQAAGSIQAQRIEKLRRRHACDLPESAVEMKWTGAGDFSHGLKRHG